MGRAVARSGRRKLHRNEHSELENGIADIKKQLEDASQSKLALTLQLKELQATKKSLGRAPRNSHSIDRYGNTTAIPRVSSAPLQADDDSDVEVMEDKSSVNLRPPSPSSDLNDVELMDYASRPSTAPPSGSSGFDLLSHASDFDDSDRDHDGQYAFDGEMDANGGEGMLGEDGYDAPHFGHYLLGAPGFDLDQFLDECGRIEEREDTTN
ncbi:hypothetical protein FB451DRAFT_1175066 [Mycena latifolia]|nr:hypothetical protein FB451DRAFT_1175066 [Mycena latifolia]